jgi:hypothetical protein
MHTDIHALSGIRTPYPSLRASEDNSCLRLLGYRDRLSSSLLLIISPLFQILKLPDLKNKTDIMGKGKYEVVHVLN